MILLADSTPLPYVALGVCILAALVGTVVGLYQWRRRWLVIDTPTSRCAAVFVGRNEVIGRAEATSTVWAPVAGRPCVWVGWEIEKWETRGEGGSWRTVDKGGSARPFLVTDDTGSVVVKPAGAEVMAPRKDRREADSWGMAEFRQELRRAGSAIEDLAPTQPAVAQASPGAPPAGDPMLWGSRGREWGTSTFSSRSSSAPLVGSAARYRVSERRIEPGDDLYVLGDAAPGEGGGLQFASGPGRGRLIVAQGSEEAVADGAGTWAGVGLLAGLAGTMGIPAAVHAVRTAGPDGPEPGSLNLAQAAQGAMLVAGGIFLAILALVWLVRVFNRLVTVKEQAARAWSMIDVALRRRHDLLPALVEVTAGYAAHEQAVLEAAARARAAEGLAAPEELPSEETVVGASRLDRRERSDARTLLALGEAYPELDADHQFRQLRAGLVATEDRVAYARAFYNDALNVLRDRRRTFPGLLLAWAVRVPSWEPFAAGATAGETPAVAPGVTASSGRRSA